MSASDSLSEKIIRATVPWGGGKPLRGEATLRNPFVGEESDLELIIRELRGFELASMARISALKLS